VSRFDRDKLDSNQISRRQQTVAEGFKGMVQNLHASKQFRPFAAAMCMGWIDVNGQVNFEWYVIINVSWSFWTSLESYSQGGSGS
jgi:hypothetical protein